MIQQKVTSLSPRTRLSSFLLLLFIILLPLQWISVIKIFGFNVKIFHIVIAISSMIVLFGINRNTKREIFKTGSLFWASYGIYLVFNIISLAWSGNIVASSIIVIQMILEFVFFIVLVLLLLDNNALSLERNVRTAVSMGLLIFIAVAIFIFNAVGRNFVTEILLSIRSTDAYKLQFGFYPVIFNYQQGQILTKQDADFLGTSFRNSLVGVFITFIILSNIYKHNFLVRKRLGLIVWIMVNITAISLVLLSVSRSNIIVLFLVYALAFLVKVLKFFTLSKRLKTSSTRPYSKRFLIMLIIFLGLMILGISFLAFQQEYISGYVGILNGRLSSIRDDGRIDMFSSALNQINRSPFIGYGVGSTVATEIRDHRVHNIFLASWLEAGFGGFLSSVTFYFALVIMETRYLLIILRHPTWWKLNSNSVWVTTLLVLPLFRPLVSGAGSLTIAEWLSVAIFFSLLIKNISYNKALIIGGQHQ